MPVTELKNSTIELSITADIGVSATAENFLALVRAVKVLNDTVAMSQYQIERNGAADEWTVTATAADEREYTTTIIMVGGVPFFSLTSFPSATALETDAFLSLIKHFVPYLKPNGVSLVTIEW